MKTTNTNILKAAALRQFHGEDFFILFDEEGNPTAYEGTEEEAKEQFNDSLIEEPLNRHEDEYTEFFEWCKDNLTEVDEYDEDANNNYLVLTNEEADDKWEESLDNYLEECIYPELQGNLKNYFDDEKWKDDARMDGRGHSLSSYDGNENEETVEGETFYIYRIN
jgi:hypothetical protein